MSMKDLQMHLDYCGKTEAGNDIKKRPHGGLVTCHSNGSLNTIAARITKVAK
jgi:hypothetical protein